MRGWPVQQVETEKRRATVLMYLHDTPGYELNEELLLLACRTKGIPTTVDHIRMALKWLADHHLITLRGEPGAQIARLTEGGSEVATGDRVVPGVLRSGRGRDDRMPALARPGAPL